MTFLFLFSPSTLQNQIIHCNLLQTSETTNIPESNSIREEVVSDPCSYFLPLCRTNAVNLEGPWECDERCHQVQNCAINNVDYDDYRLCVTQAKALSVSGADREERKNGVPVGKIAAI